MSKGEHRADEDRLRTILDSMVEAVFVTDEDGRVILTNEALDALIAKDVRGRRAKNVIKSKALRVAIRRARKQNEATETELETEIGDRVHIFHAHVAPLPKNAGVVAVLHDVTSLKNADRIRRNFVVNASHELRTPLTAIRGFTETLIDGADDEPQTRRRFLDAIFRHTLRLERLVTDLTVLGQAESPQFGWDSHPTDVGVVCRESVGALEALAKSKRIEVELDLPDAPVVVVLSPNALDHVLVNLIENAIKYSPEGGEVRVRVRRVDDSVVIDVRDRGPGIPVESRDRIYERFYRVDKGRSRDDGGSGLGLSIARNLVERMQGTIELDSQLGRGSVFRVRLPIDPVEEADE